MTDVMTVARRYEARQQLLTARAVRAAWREWHRLDAADLSGSWRTVGPRLVAVLTAGQSAAAAGASAYVDQAVRAQGVEPDTQDAVNPEGFAGWAADGRSLDTLMLRTLITTKEGIGGGLGVQDALSLGGRLMSMYLATEVGDAGRSAEGVGMRATRRVHSYVRVMGGKGCARCAILAGETYHTDRVFLRHPNCKCRNVPVADGGRNPPAPLDASSYFHGLSRAEQDRLFTIGGARAIRDGADITSVVNARRGVYNATAYGRRLAATRDSTTRRGLFYQAERRRAVARGDTTAADFRLRTPRLLPEEIYRQANSPEMALELLRRFGYLT